jgi:hypothetical protein
MLKPLIIKNCSGCTFINGKYYCGSSTLECYEIRDCLLKRILEKPKNRKDYVKQKLSNCFGYNEEEKKIRYEELSWLMREYENMLEVQLWD